MKLGNLLRIVLVLGLALPLLVACGGQPAAPAPTAAAAKPAAAPAPTAAPAPAQAPPAPTQAAVSAAATKPAAAAAAAETYTLKFGTWMAETIVAGRALKWYLDEVEKQSNGRIKFERYWAESLVAAKDIPDAIDKGILDVGLINPSYYPGKFPVGMVFSLPGIGTDLYSTVRGLRESYQKLPILQEEAAKLNIRYLVSYGSGPYKLLSRKEVKSVDELKGLKLRGLGLQLDLLKALGATPVSITAPELFDALSRGTVDGTGTTASMATGYSLQEAAKFFANVPLGYPTYFVGIRTQTWAKLPKDLQDMMDQVANDYLVKFTQIYEIDGEGSELKKMIAAGVKTVDLPQSEIDKVTAAAKSTVWEKWVADTKTASARDVLNAYVSFADKAGKESPFLKRLSKRF